ncbi:serine/threonine protein kinase [Sorangium sp. So ce388]|uniref:serine/threonine protein kinase n=1 Tax=Sorangium sp. So ce388 TaxID=3133309 RepID=UPI003F5AE362
MGREALKAGDVFLDYRVTEVIDAGGMGEVYKAVEDYSEDIVAIKCMSPRHVKREDFARRFRQECKFYPKLKHPNIVRMRKAGVSPEDVAYIVMDYLEGRTLRKVLNKIYRLDFLSAMHVMLQVADAMTFVHSKGIWHRDLKPENIMVGAKGDAKGHVWLLDFGIAKFADGGMNTDDLPDVGTVRYISPEQVQMLYATSRKAERGERARPDGRTDIYAFGAIFYEVLTGKHLFLDDSEPATAEETLTGHLVAAPEPVHELVPDCPEFVWPVVSRCIAIDREERYAKFDEVARDLRLLLRDTVPAGHVLARRLAQERMRAERQAAFAEVELEDSAPVAEEAGARSAGREEETEEARARGEGGSEGGARGAGWGEGARRRQEKRRGRGGWCTGRRRRWSSSLRRRARCRSRRRRGSRRACRAGGAWGTPSRCRRCCRRCRCAGAREGVGTRGCGRRPRGWQGRGRRGWRREEGRRRCREARRSTRRWRRRPRWERRARCRRRCP